VEVKKMASRTVDIEKERKRAHKPGAGHPINYPLKDSTVVATDAFHKISKKPPALQKKLRASQFFMGRKTREVSEPQKDEHGCIIGKEVFDFSIGRCVPTPPTPKAQPTLEETKELRRKEKLHPTQR
jgi:hypothetical protein